MLEMRDIDSISPPFLSEESRRRALLVVVFSGERVGVTLRSLCGMAQAVSPRLHNTIPLWVEKQSEAVSVDIRYSL